MPTQVLQIPELLSIIFSHIDKPTIAVCAIVCKRWLEPALDEIWRHVDDLQVVFKLLAPTHTPEKKFHRHLLFSRFVSPSDWSRFEFYASRIRSLKNDSSPKIDIDQSIYAEIARTRPKLVILPKLQQLVWEARLLNQGILFMSPSVMHLVASIDRPFLAHEGFLEARAFLLDAAVRLPNLVSLSIKASFSVRNIQEAFFTLLENIPKLEMLVIPRYWLTSDIMTRLARSQCLKVVQWEYEGQGEGDRKDVEDFNISLCNNAFPALVDLSLEVNLHAATELVKNRAFSARLASFMVDSLSLAPPPDIQRFLASCSTNCQSLTELHLDLHCVTLEGTSDSSQITLATIEPVLSCPNLLVFTLLHNEPLAINDNDVKIIASRWPSLVSLFLNNQPTTLSTPLLSLAALLPFIEYCPRLEELGLYIDASAPIPSLPDHHTFAKLRALHVGTSLIEEADPVALFLSRVCPPLSSGSPLAKAIEISWTLSWDPALSASLSRLVHEESQTRISIWKCVHTYLPVVLAMRAEERSRSKELEDELKRLRSRNQALEAHASQTSAVESR